MILLEAYQYLVFGGIPVTDWMQSIGALVAIIGVLWGFYQFYKDAKEKQTQIDALTELAKESREQTNHLASQVDQMKRANDIQEANIKTQLHQRKLDIKPNFRIGIRNSDLNNVSYNIINSGETAKLLNYELLDGNQMNVTECTELGKVIHNEYSFIIFLKPIPVGLNTYQCNTSIKIIYEDRQGYQYYQEINANGIVNATISEPIEINYE